MGGRWAAPRPCVCVAGQGSAHVAAAVEHCRAACCAAAGCPCHAARRPTFGASLTVFAGRPTTWQHHSYIAPGGRPLLLTERAPDHCPYCSPPRVIDATIAALKQSIAAGGGARHGSGAPLAARAQQWAGQRQMATTTTQFLNPRIAAAAPPLVDDDLGDILSRDIPWETYLTARLISERDVQLLRRYDKRPEELQSSLLDENGALYAEALMSVLRNVTKEETVQYVLALLVQMLAVNPARAQLFHQQPAGAPAASDPYAVFLRLLQRQDWFTQDKACRVLAQVLAARPKGLDCGSGGGGGGAGEVAAAPGDPAEAAVAVFVDWLCNQLRRPTNPTKSVPCAVAALATLLRERSARALFARGGGVQLLAPLLRSCNSPANSQLLYEICLCLWQLSYYRPAAEAMAGSGAIKGLVDVVKAAQKEKVVRVALLALRNLLEEDNLGLAADMVEAGLPKVVAQRSMQTWGDEDIPPVLESMSEALKRGVTVMSSFDKYKKEVMSGMLDWTPMHTSELFWRQNIDRFEDKDFQVLRVLLKLLEASREVRTLAVACNDLGRFIEAHPHGRYVVSDLRGKELVMRLMSHPDPEVQKRALLCVQKIMLPKDKLDFLAAASG
ncbi:MAG: armadillo-type protein [Monoraphidium minutum]|nr:MAG: armadillo-type protein [Monoraphidium minutum]